MERRFTRLIVIAFQAFALGGYAPRAFSTPVHSFDAQEVRRGFIVVGVKTSDEPALRAERRIRLPPPSFELGAALSAWINASAALEYDLKTPTGDGGDQEQIGEDCYDEKAAFSHLEASAQELSAAPSSVLTAAAVDDPKVVARWTARERGGAPASCR